MTLVITTGLVAAVIAAAITYLLTRSQAGRELAEARATWATDLASARQDNKWLQQEIERERESVAGTRTLLDTAERQLREAFQSLAAEALHANRGAFLDQAKATFEGFKQETTAQIDARHKAIDSLVQPITDTLKTVETHIASIFSKLGLEPQPDSHRRVLAVLTYLRAE